MLFDKFKLGRLELANRVVMAPMTRVRATESGVPTDATALYYAQRATAGLIISEGISPSRQAQSGPNIPGLYNEEQERAWATVTDSVHRAGGLIFAQLMHGGRIGHPEINGFQPLGPSAIAAAGTIFSFSGRLALEPPLAMTTDQVIQQVEVFTNAARRAVAAGFDGVELHGANGYLIQQFLAGNSNHRDDQYGGSIANRVRFAVEVSQAIADAIGADRVGIRLSPAGKFHDMAETDVADLYGELIKQLDPIGLAYLHILDTAPTTVNERIQDLWNGVLIVNPAVVGGEEIADKASAEAWRRRGADLIAFGRYFISNPDLVRRLRDNVPLAQPNPATFYGNSNEGYTDYPALPV